MFHLIIYKKSTGEVSRVISRDRPVLVKLTDLGYNPVLFETIKVVSQLASINPAEWEVRNGVLSKRVNATLPANPLAKEPEGNLKLVFVGDKPTDLTGFGTQYAILSEGLKKRSYSIQFIGFNEIDKLVDIDCDYVLMLSDYSSSKKVYDLGLKNLIFWFALESNQWPAEWNQNLILVPHLVPLTKYGERAMKEAGLTCHDPIAHGVQTDALHPIPLRQRAVLRRENKVDSNFVISYLGTNVDRKHIDLLIESYAKFVSKYDNKFDTLLLLKTKTKGAYDIPSLVNDLGVKYKIVNFNSMVRVLTKDMDSEQINEFINISDLGFNATAGEGFCVPLVEYLMCGVPFIMGDHTTAKELLGEICPTIKIKEQIVDPRYKWNRYLIDIDHAADCINSYYKKWKASELPNRQTLRQYATRYSAQQMIDSWDLLLQDIETARIDKEFVKKAASVVLDNAQTVDDITGAYERAKTVVDSAPETSTAVAWMRLY